MHTGPLLPSQVSARGSILSCIDTWTPGNPQAAPTANLYKGHPTSREPVNTQCQFNLSLLSPTCSPHSLNPTAPSFQRNTTVAGGQSLFYLLLNFSNPHSTVWLENHAFLTLNFLPSIPESSLFRQSYIYSITSCSESYLLVLAAVPYYTLRPAFPGHKSITVSGEPRNLLVEETLSLRNTPLTPS